MVIDLLPHLLARRLDQLEHAIEVSDAELVDRLADDILRIDEKLTGKEVTA